VFFTLWRERKIPYAPFMSASVLRRNENSGLIVGACYYGTEVVVRIHCCSSVALGMPV
jgi:hypothetical protein